MSIQFTNPYGGRSNLLISMGADTLRINQFKCLLKPRAGDIEPYELIMDYMSTRSDDDNRLLFDLYSEGRDNISFQDGNFQDMGEESIHGIIKLIDFQRLVSFTSRVVNIPPRIMNMDKSQIDKLTISSYDGKEYTEMCALIILFTALSPLLAHILLLSDPVIGEYGYTLIHKLLNRCPEFRELSIYRKYLGHVRIVNSTQGNGGSQIDKTLSRDGVVMSLALSSILGRLGTHNIPKDVDGLNVPSRIFNVILGKSKPSVAKAGGVSNEDISLYDIRRPFLITGNVEEEGKWLTEDIWRFAGQYPLSEEDKDDIEYGLKHVDGYMTPPMLAIMAVLLREYIDPRAIQMLGIGRDGRPNAKHINNCRATAYMLAKDYSDPFFAKLMLAKHVASDEGITLGKSNKNITFEVIREAYSFSKGDKESPVMASIQLISDTLRSSQYEDVTDGRATLDIGGNIKLRIAQFFNEKGI